MGLSNDIISQFVKATNDSKKTAKTETITYGEVSKVVDGQVHVVLDGTIEVDNKKSEVPVTTTVDVSVKDRVIIMIKNHSAVIIGNLGNPATTSEYVDAKTGAIVETVNEASTKANEAANKVDQFGLVLAQKVDTTEFTAKVAAIENLESESVLTQKVKANEASVESLVTENAEIKGKLEAAEAKIDQLEADIITTEELDAKYAQIESLNAVDAKVGDLSSTHAKFETAIAENFKATNASITELDSKKLDAESAKVIYANIDFSNIGEAAIRQFFSKSGMIDNLVVGDGTITGKLVGVTISGDLIEGNTVKADKLVVKGSDGLYYKLNIEAGATTSTEVSEDDLQNGLHGTAIIAKTITAEKISVSDLVAFGATIGGFHISDDSLYSGTKSSVDNTTQGIYLDSTGQMAVGDSNNFIKYYKAADGSYKLEISASSVLLGTGKKSVETAINEVKSSVDNIEIGGRNLAIDSANNYANPSFNQFAATISGVNDYEITSDTYNSLVIAKWSGSSTSKWSGPFFGINGMLGATLEVGQTYTVSAWMKADAATTVNESSLAEGQTVIAHQNTIGTDWTRVWTVFRAAEVTKNVCFYTGPNATAEAPYIYMCGLKLEKGNKATDWTPAPEDMATAQEVDTAQSTANEADEKASNAQTLIAQLSDSISMLVTDGNGTSLMTQTENGWTFSTSNIQSSVNNIIEALDSLTTEVGDANNTVDILQQAVDDLGVIAEYVHITTYEDEPCIELGESDSDFKLRITNTRMMFTEGSSVLAYFTNQAFNSKKVVIEEELQQGGYVWKTRSNGHLGLTWKGGNV